MSITYLINLYRHTSNFPQVIFVGNIISPINYVRNIYYIFDIKLSYITYI